jgi:(p)ppGpp synthase/HD superfamily hydrolase
LIIKRKWDNATITGREKTPFSIWRKIQNKKISLEQLN